MTNRVVVGSLVIASVLLGGSAAAEQRVSGARIVVRETYYAVGKSAFDDLDSLERSVLATSPRSIELRGCGPGSSRALLSAAHRFSQLPQYLQVFDTKAAPCAAVPKTVRAGQPAVQKPTGIDDSAVDHYWRQVAP